MIHDVSRIQSYLKGLYKQPTQLLVEPTGSQYICDPPPFLENSDVDYVVYCGTKDNLKSLRTTLMNDSWVFGGSLFEDNDFASFKKQMDKDGPVINLITTHKRKFFDYFVLATKIAKDYNVIDKEKRVKLFEDVRRGKTWVDV